MGFWSQIFTHVKRLSLLHSRQLGRKHFIWIEEAVHLIFLCIVVLLFCAFDYYNVRNKPETQNSSKDTAGHMDIWYYPNDMELPVGMENNLRYPGKMEQPRKGTKYPFKSEVQVREGVRLNVSKSYFIVQLCDNTEKSVVFRKGMYENNLQDNEAVSDELLSYLMTAYKTTGMNVVFSRKQCTYGLYIYDGWFWIILYLGWKSGMIFLLFVHDEKIVKLHDAMVLLGGNGQAYVVSWYLQILVHNILHTLMYGLFYFCVSVELTDHPAAHMFMIAYFLFSNFVSAACVTLYIILPKTRVVMLLVTIYHGLLFRISLLPCDKLHGWIDFLLPHMVLACFTRYPDVYEENDITKSPGFWKRLTHPLIGYLILVVLGLTAATLQVSFWFQWFRDSKKDCGTFVNFDQGDISIFDKAIIKLSAKKNRESIIPKDFTMSIYEKRATVILDTSKTKRTSILKTVMGRQRFSNEKVSIDEDLRICMCPDIDFLFDMLTVEETMEIYYKILGVPSKQSVYAIADDFYLIEKLTVKVENLSPDFKKLLMLAIAFLREAEIYLLDEPTKGLRSHSLHMAINCISRKKRDATIIMTSSESQDAARMCDTIALVVDNKIRLYGTLLFIEQNLGVGTHIQIDISNRKTLRSLCIYMWLFAPMMVSLKTLCLDDPLTPLRINFFIGGFGNHIIEYVITNLRQRVSEFNITKLYMSDVGIERVLRGVNRVSLLGSLMANYRNSIAISDCLGVPIIQHIKQWLTQVDQGTRQVRQSSSVDGFHQLVVGSVVSAGSFNTENAGLLDSAMSLTDFLKIVSLRYNIQHQSGPSEKTVSGAASSCVDYNPAYSISKNLMSSQDEKLHNGLGVRKSHSQLNMLDQNDNRGNDICDNNVCGNIEYNISQLLNGYSIPKYLMSPEELHMGIELRRLHPWSGMLNERNSRKDDVGDNVDYNLSRLNGQNHLLFKDGTSQISLGLRRSASPLNKLEISNDKDNDNCCSNVSGNVECNRIYSIPEKLVAFKDEKALSGLSLRRATMSLWNKFEESNSKDNCGCDVSREINKSNNGENQCSVISSMTLNNPVDRDCNNNNPTKQQSSDMFIFKSPSATVLEDYNLRVYRMMVWGLDNETDLPFPFPRSKSEKSLKAQIKSIKPFPFLRHALRVSVCNRIGWSFLILLVMSIVCLFQTREVKHILHRMQTHKIHKSLGRHLNIHPFPTSDKMDKESETWKFWYHQTLKDLWSPKPVHSHVDVCDDHITYVGANPPSGPSQKNKSPMNLTIQFSENYHYLSLVTALEALQRSDKHLEISTVDLKKMYFNPVPLANRCGFLDRRFGRMLNILSCLFGFTAWCLILCTAKLFLDNTAIQFHNLLVLSGATGTSLYLTRTTINTIVHVVIVTPFFIGFSLFEEKEYFLEHYHLVFCFVLVQTTFALCAFAFVNCFQLASFTKGSLVVWVMYEGACIVISLLYRHVTYILCVISPTAGLLEAYRIILHEVLLIMTMLFKPHPRFKSLDCESATYDWINDCSTFNFIQIVYICVAHIVFFLVFFINFKIKDFCTWKPEGIEEKGNNHKKDSCHIHAFNFEVERSKCLAMYSQHQPIHGLTSTAQALINPSGLKKGAVLFGGNILAKSKKSQTIGYCPMEDGLEPCMTGRGILQLFGSFRRKSSEQLAFDIDEMLEDLRLDRIADLQVKKYSDQDRHKLQVATSLIGEPKFLLLDHPTHGLNLMDQMRTWNRIKNYRDRGHVVIITSNCAEECYMLGTTNIVLSKHFIKLCCTSEELKAMSEGYFAFVWLHRDHRGRSVQVVKVVREVQRRFYHGVFAIADKANHDPYVIFSFVTGNVGLDLDHPKIYDTLENMKESCLIRHYEVREVSPQLSLEAYVHEWMPY